MSEFTAQLASQISQDVQSATDAVLLERFAEFRDGGAFEELVGRHGRMVLAVCRRILGDAHDAEDAFQSTFLVLARKASEIRDPELLGNWLYGVSYRVARKARVARPGSRALPPLESERPQPDVEVAAQELQSVVDEELHGLPLRERTLLTLAYLQGLTHREIASRFEWPTGSVSRRLEKARDVLRIRLQRRGILLTSALLLTLLSELEVGAAVPSSVVASTAKEAVEAGSEAAPVARHPVATDGSALGSRVVWAAVVLTVLLLGSAGVVAIEAGSVSGTAATDQRDKAAAPDDSDDHSCSG